MGSMFFILAIIGLLTFKFVLPALISKPKVINPALGMVNPNDLDDYPIFPDFKLYSKYSASLLLKDPDETENTPV